MPHPPAPNFRVPKRLITWMEVNCVRERVLSAENVFFKTNIAVDVRAHALVQYAQQLAGVHQLTPEMEVVISEVPSACVSYASTLRRYGREVPQEIVDSCGTLVPHMAGALGRRIPHLEHKIVNAADYLDYWSAVKVRVPEIEDRVLVGDSAPRWAFKLIERVWGSGYGTPTHAASKEILADQKLKDLMKQDISVVASFMEFCARRSMKLPQEFHHLFAGDGGKLFALASHLRSRLPVELEMTWQGAKSELVQYAVRWVQGPLPEVLEDILIGDTKAITDYAFQVIRGFASPRLGDTLHNCLLIGDQTEEVQRYIAECDRIERWKSLIEQGIAAAG